MSLSLLGAKRQAFKGLNFGVLFCQISHILEYQICDFLVIWEIMQIAWDRRTWLENSLHDNGWG